MTRQRRIILSLALFVLGVGVILAAGATALYHHPATAKALLEAWLSSRFEARVAIGEVSYGLAPFTLTAADIAIRGSGLEARIDSLEVVCRLEGPFGERTLAVERLALSGFSLKLEGGAPWEKLIRSSGPPTALDRLISKASGVLLFRDLRWEQVAAAAGDLSWDNGEMRMALRHIDAVTVTDGIQVDGSAHIHWPVADAALEAPLFRAFFNLSVFAGREGLGGRLQLPETRFTGAGATASASRSEVNLAIELHPGRIAAAVGQAGCEVFTLKADDRPEIVVDALRLSLSGDYDRSGHLLVLERWSASAADLMDLSGTARVKVSAPQAIELTLADGRLFPKKVLPVALQVAGHQPAPVSVAGTVAVTGSLVLQETDQGWVEEGRLTAAFDQNAVKANWGPLQIEGVITGSLKAAGRVSAPAFAANLSGRQFRLAGGGVQLQQVAFDVAAEGDYPVFSIPNAEIRSPAAALPLADDVYPINDLVLRLKKGRFDATGATVSIPEISLDSDVLRNLKGSISGDSRQLTLDLAGRDVGWIEAAERFGLLPPTWRFSAADRFQAKALWQPEGESTVSATIELNQARFSDPSDRCVGEDLALRAEIGLRTQRRENAAAVTAAARATKGELLWEGIYIDLGATPVSGASELHYARDSRRLQIKAIQLEVHHLLTVHAKGSASFKAPQPVYDLTLHMPAAPISPVFAAFVAEPLRYKTPALSGMAVGGQLSADLAVSAAADGRTARGRVNWSSGSLSTPDEVVRLEGIELSLPLWHRTGSRIHGEPPMKGELAVDRITLPALPAQELKLPLSAGPGQLTAGAGMRVRFPSGEIRFDAIACRDLFSARPKVNTRMTVDRVHAGHFLKGIWSSPVEAVLSGNLGEIDFDGRDLRSRGRLVADIFGGKIMVDNPGVNGALSAAPAVGADCLIEGLDLSELTRDTAFGRIQGVLSGFVNHLEIVNRQPQRFVLQLETVPRPGVPQRINVEAVENIARIGGGQSPFVGLAGNVASFFKEFVYAKIGVRALLENDQFRINGTITEDGVEYLVRKGGLPGVDIVNLNPTNQISFKDMVKRVQRVSESESGPVVR